MADPTPTPPGAPVPPKPPEAAKVQPKKETVRINLPPKPTAAPTIKIPSPAAVAAAAPAASAPAVGASPGVAAAPPAAAPARAAAPMAAAPVAAAPARPAPVRSATAAPAVNTIDMVLALVAAVVGLAVVVRVFLLAGS